MRRRLWCERIPPAELAAESTQGLLRRFGLEPVLALPPELERPELGRALTALSRLGLPVTLAPLGPGGESFGSNEATAAARRVEAALDFARASEAEIRGVIVRLGRDPRPTGDPLRGLGAAARAAWRLGSGGEGAGGGDAAFSRLVADLQGAGLEAAAEVSGWLALDLEAGVRRVGEHLDVAGLFAGWDRVVLRVGSPPLRAFGLRGPWAQGGVAALAERARRAAGSRVALGLGPVGPGPRGDGPMLRTPRDLRRDVAAARAAGIDDLCLDGLAGVLRRGRPSAWLEALAAADAKPPPSWARGPSEAALRALRRRISKP